MLVSAICIYEGGFGDNPIVNRNQNKCLEEENGHKVYIHATFILLKYLIIFKQLNGG
jgi:hypothetical protein